MGFLSNVFDSITGAGQAKKAAKKSAAGAEQAEGNINAMYNQTRADLAPYQSVGKQALNTLAATAGYQTYGPEQEAAAAAAEGSNDPYQPADPSKLVDTGKISDNGLKVMVDPDTGFGYWIARKGSNAGSAVPIGSKVAGWPLTNKAAAALSAVENKAGAPIGKPTLQYFQESPDYQFRKSEGINALDRSASARGRVLSGAQKKGVLDYGGQLASAEFGNWWDRTERLANTGMNAATQTGAFGANAVNNAGQAGMAAADARASGNLASANVQNSLFQTVAGLGTYAALGGLKGGNTTRNSGYRQKA